MVTVRRPPGYTVKSLDRAMEQASRRLTDVCLLPAFSLAVSTDELGFLHLPWGSDSGMVADRWLLIRHRTTKCARVRTAALSELAGVQLHAPRLPSALHSNLAALADEANAALDASDAGLAEVLAEVEKS